MQEGQIIDRAYIIEKKIAEGGMAVVYRATVDFSRFDYTLIYAYTQVQGASHTARRKNAEIFAQKLAGKKLDPATVCAILEAHNIPLPQKVVALKVAKSTNDLARFEAEWKNLLCLNHNNVIKVYGGGMYQNKPYYAMEFLEHIVPPERIAKEFDLYQKIQIIIEAGRGLAYLHRNGIIHRDVKPDNMVVNEEVPGRFVTKITDLGIAKNIDDSMGTMTEAIFGTPRYMSPEQIVSTKDVDFRADIYSLGASLYHLMAGVPPYHERTTAFEIIAAVARGEPPQPLQFLAQNIPEPILLITSCAMARNVEERYQSMDEMVHDLETFLQKEAPERYAEICQKRSADEEILAPNGYAFQTTKKRPVEASVMLPPSGAAGWGQPQASWAPPPPAGVAFYSSQTITSSQEGMATGAPPPSPYAAPSPTPFSAPQPGGLGRPLSQPSSAPSVASMTPTPPSSVLPPFEVYTNWPFSEADIERQQLETAAALEIDVHFRLRLPLGVPMDFILIPAGVFMMGSPESERGRRDDEGPRREVRISRPFYLAKTPVTQAQWKAVLGENPSRFQQARDSMRRPVEMISWKDVVERFLPKLQALLSPGWTCRLPTEAEWEYACRAGSSSPYSFGQEIGTDQANFDGSRHFFRGERGENRQETTPVDMFEPNAYGLHDMHGNVWEWCQDWYDATFYRRGGNVDPVNETPSGFRVVRGGNWSLGPILCRAAARDMCAPENRLPYVGARIAITLL